MKANQQSSQASKPAVEGNPLPAQPSRVVGRPPRQAIPNPVEEEQIEDDEDTNTSDEMPQEAEKPAVMPQAREIEASKGQGSEEMTKEQQILMEIEMLQNNGRYRAELLHQLQEINRALVVIAGVLVDLTGTEKK